MRANNIFFISRTLSDSDPGVMSPLNSLHLPGFEVKYQGSLRRTGVMDLFQSAGQGAPQLRVPFVDAIPIRRNPRAGCGGLPFVTAQELRENHPWPLLSVP